MNYKYDVNKNLSNSKNNYTKLPRNTKMEEILSMINKKALPTHQIYKRKVNFLIFDESSSSARNIFSNHKYLDPKMRKVSQKFNSFTDIRNFKIYNTNNNISSSDFNPQFNINHFMCKKNENMIKKDGNYSTIRKSDDYINNKKNIMIYNTYINHKNVTNKSDININFYNDTHVNRNLISFNNLKNFEYKRNNSRKKLYYYSIIKIQSFWRGYALRKNIIENIKYYNYYLKYFYQILISIFSNHIKEYFFHLIRNMYKIKKIRTPYRKKINQSIRSVRYNYIKNKNNNSLIKNKNYILYSIVIIIKKINKICYIRYYNDIEKKLKLLKQKNINTTKYNQLKKVIHIINKKILKKYFRVYKENVLIEKIKEKILTKRIQNLTVSDPKFNEHKKFVKIKKVKRNNKNHPLSNSKSSFERSLGNSDHKIIACSMTPKKLNIKKVYINRTRRNFITFINNDRCDIKNRKLMKIIEKIDKKHILNRNFKFWKKSSNDK